MTDVVTPPFYGIQFLLLATLVLSGVRLQAPEPLKSDSLRTQPVEPSARPSTTPDIPTTGCSSSNTTHFDDPQMVSQCPMGR